MDSLDFRNDNELNRSIGNPPHITLRLVRHAVLFLEMTRHAPHGPRWTYHSFCHIPSRPHLHFWSRVVLNNLATIYKPRRRGGLWLFE